MIVYLTTLILDRVHRWQQDAGIRIKGIYEMMNVGIRCVYIFFIWLITVENSIKLKSTV